MSRLLRFAYTLSCLMVLGAIAAKAQVPVADFTAAPTSACSPAVVQFTDASTNAPTSWSWNLGNGTTSTLQNPSTTYNTAGTYTVTLTATNASGSGTKTSTSFITILPAPTAAFSATDTTIGCGSKIVQFSNSSVLGASGSGTYYWDFGDGTNSSAISPTHTYNTPGSYAVSLVVSNSAGCTQILTKNQFVNVVAKPTAAFTATNNNSCNAPVTTSFASTSTNAVSYAWDFGDGGTSTSISPTHTYTTSGSYAVRLIVTGSAGCKDTITKSAFVNIGSLAASFTKSTSITCTNNNVAFVNTTTPGAGGSMWYFGDGSTSTVANPTHAYSTAGTYTVKLVVTYNNCADSASSTVTVSAGPTTSFSANPLTSCSAPLTTSFTNNTTNATSYLWDFGDGSTNTGPNPSHTYNAVGNYTVTLISTSANSCTDTLKKVSYIAIQPISASIVGNSLTGCAPATGSFTASVISLVPITSYSWNFGDGSPTGSGASVTHTYAASGAYTLTLTVTAGAGCTATATKTVIVSAKPTAAFSANPTTSCANSPVVFTSTSTGATTYTWLFGDGASGSGSSSIHNYEAPGTYNVTLIASNNGCSDTLVKTNYITILNPSADFTFSFPCSNRLAYTFTNMSVGATSYSWNFGDGTTSTLTNPTHTFLAVGYYPVTLTATSSITGCTTSIQKLIGVFNIFSNYVSNDTNTCKGSPTVFTATLNPVNGVYTWTYGDGTPNDAGYNIIVRSHTYAATGVYTTKLTFTDTYGCSDSTTKPNYIHVNSPTAAFTNTPDSGCGALTVTFTDLSTASAGSSITNRKWVFGDGSIVNTAASNITHTYVSGGNYTVTLVVTQASGCTDSVTRANLILVSRPSAQFLSPDSLGCLNKLVTFLNTSTGTGSLTYNWSFGDGTTATSISPNHTYTSAGNYTIRLAVSQLNGCTDTLTRNTYVNIQGINAGFTMSDSNGSCPPFTVSFTNTSVNGASYMWLFGNGSSSVLANPSATFTSPGTYQVKLIATNANGCNDTATHTVVVGPSPSGTLTYLPVTNCAPMTVSFSTTSLNSTSITYDLDNGVTQTTTASTITYTYTQPGIFIPKVIFHNIGGCNTYLQGTDTIRNTKAYAGFSTSLATVCIGGSIQFTDSSHAVASTIATRTWSFGDGATSTSTNPSHIYATAGTYTVRQIVATNIGCADTAYTTVTINPLPVLTMVSNPTICSGASTQLLVSGAATYSWSPASGLSCTTCANPVASPTATTTYTLTATSAQGCIATSTVTVSVAPVPTVGVSASVSICGGASTSLNATGASSYVWSPASGLSCTSCASPSATPAATTTYKVVGTNASGCTDSATVTVTVNPTPIIVTSGNQSICPGGSATLSASGAASYTWSPAAGLSCTSCANPVATPAAATTYKVVGTSALGCTDSANITLTVNPTLLVGVTGINTICAGSTTTLTATGAASYSWSPATGLSCTYCASPVASPATTTTYTVTGTSAGCTGTTTYTITVNPLPVINAGIDTAFCQGDAVTLNATGAATYSWSPAGGLSCTSCASPIAGPATTTTYVVTGTSVAGCSNADTVMVTVKTPPVISAGNNVSICPGGSVVLNASGGLTYVWTPSTGLSCTACASPTASPSSNTLYTVTGTGANGCSSNASVSVAINANPSLTISGNNVICAGANTVLTASGANAFSWTPATGLSCTNCANPTANPGTTTTYTITGTSGVGCTATTTFTLTVNPLPAVSGGPDKSICAGSSATLNASGASTYSWSPTTGLSCTNCASPIANPGTTTVYTVTGLNASGCVNTANVTVTVNPLPTVSAGSNVSICPGGSTTLVATGALTYSWSPATGLSCTNCASPTASPAASTTYTVTGTSTDGCTGTGNVTVSVNPTPSVTIVGLTSICAGNSTVLTASGGSSYSWSPSTGLSCTTCANPIANPATTTTYTVTGTSGVGCTGTATFTLAVNPLPAVNAGTDKTICFGTSTTVTATGASTYSWTPATGLSCTTCASPAATPGATTTYIVTGTSTFGCVNTDTVVVNVNSLPLISAGSNMGVCPGGSVTLSPSGGVSYVWNASPSLSCTACTSPVASPSATTTYTVTGTGANGCTAVSSVTVTVNPLPVVSVAGNTDVCAGSSSTLTATGTATYSWTPATNLSCTNCASPVVTPTATTTYTVVGTSGTGCIDSAHITINLRPLPIITVDTPQTICLNTPVQLTSGGASSYSWTPAAGLSCTTCASPIATPVVTTTYIVSGTDSYGCIGSAQTTITILDLPKVDAGPDVSICKATSATLSASGAVTYVWSPAASLSCSTCTNPVASPATTTSYVLTGTGINGCVNTDTIVVSLYAQPLVNAGPDQTICAGREALLQASGAVTYVWTPAGSLSCATCANPTATPMHNITYGLVGTDAHGCVDSDMVNITVIEHRPVEVGPGGEVCAGASVQLSASGGDSYTWYPAAGLSCNNCPDPTANPSESTTYYVSIRQGQCFSDTLSAKVVIHPLPTVDAGPDLDMVLGNSVHINTTGTNIHTYSWSPLDGLSCASCADPMASPAKNMVYVVTVTSDFGCTAQDEVNVHVRCDGSQVWLPNTFTPNADGQNDRFYPHGKGILTVARFRIYDRWGELLYDRTNMPVNDKSYGWDGTYKNQPLKPDVYVWIMDGTCTNGEHMQTKGDISLIR